jgi:hypothetical protein
MEPTTKLEKASVEASKKLSPISEEVKEWARETCFENSAIIYGFEPDKCICTHCCAKFHVDDTVKRGSTIVCPECGKVLKVKKHKHRVRPEISYIMLLDVVDGLQVIRHIQVDNQDGSLYFSEVVQEWFDDDGKNVIIARPLSIVFYNLYFRTDKPMSVKRRKYNDTYFYEKYRIGGFLYPKMRVLPRLRRNGFRKSFHKMNASSFIEHLLSDSKFETLLKAKEYNLLQLRYSDKHKVTEYWKQICIAIRNHYKITDAKMWTDYLSMCQEIKLDIFNPKYVCPENLKEQHDYVMKRLHKLEAKRRAEEKRLELEQKVKNAVRENSKFQKRMKKFFCIEMKDSNLVIRPLMSVQEFLEEGEAMHHCVYDCGYYNQEDCLILTARDYSGNRIETIEVNLKNLSVSQSRAVCNGESAYHREIIELVNKNMYKIKKLVAA